MVTMAMFLSLADFLQGLRNFCIWYECKYRSIYAGGFDFAVPLEKIDARFGLSKSGRCVRNVFFFFLFRLDSLLVLFTVGLKV